MRPIAVDRCAPRGLHAIALSILLAVWGWTPCLSADQKGEMPRGPVEHIEVRESEMGPRAALDPTAFATVIRAEDFSDRVTSVQELLRDSVGIQVQSLGGEFATVSIRGSTAEQVVIYLDGIPLNRAMGGGVNLADLPLRQIESIEIYRGFTPAALPAASIGGAVVIRTRGASGKGSRSASVSAGSFGTWEGALSLSSPRGRTEYFLGVDATTSRADFTFLDDNGTPEEARDDEETSRLNNDFTRAHLSGRLARRLGQQATVSLVTDILTRRQGVPGLGANQSEDARFDTSRLLMRPEIEVPGLWGGRVLLRGAVDYGRHSESFEDRRGDLGMVRNTDHSFASFGQEAGATLVASARQAITLQAFHRRETADLREEIQNLSNIRFASRDSVTVTLEDQFALAGGRLVLNPSVRRETFSNSFQVRSATGIAPGSPRTRDSSTNGKIGFSLRINEGLALKGNFGRFLRLPAFIELFGDQGSILGNPGLQPERGRSFDLGVVATRTRPEGLLRTAHLELTLFETRADDLILFEPTGQDKVVARNSNRARVRGAEVTIGLAMGPRLSTTLNATRQRAVDVSGGPYDGNLLVGRPRDELSAGASLSLGRGRLYYNFTYVGPNFVDRPNTEITALPARYLHDIGYRLRLPHGLEAVAEVKNIDNETTFDVARYPLPGRSFHGRLSWAF